MMRKYWIATLYILFLQIDWIIAKERSLVESQEIFFSPPGLLIATDFRTESSFCIEPERKSGSKLWLRPCNFEFPSDRQLWNFIPHDGLDWISIHNVGKDKCMDGMEVETGSKLRIRNCDDRLSQRWIYEDVGVIRPFLNSTLCISSFGPTMDKRDIMKLKECPSEERTSPGNSPKISPLPQIPGTSPSPTTKHPTVFPSMSPSLVPTVDESHHSHHVYMILSGISQVMTNDQKHEFESVAKSFIQEHTPPPQQETNFPLFVLDLISVVVATQSLMVSSNGAELLVHFEVFGVLAPSSSQATFVDIVMFGFNSNFTAFEEALIEQGSSFFSDFGGPSSSSSSDIELVPSPTNVPTISPMPSSSPSSSPSLSPSLSPLSLSSSSEPSISTDIANLEDFMEDVINSPPPPRLHPGAIFLISLVGILVGACSIFAIVQSIQNQRSAMSSVDNETKSGPRLMVDHQSSQSDQLFEEIIPNSDNVVTTKPTTVRQLSIDATEKQSNKTKLNTNNNDNIPKKTFHDPHVIMNSVNQISCLEESLRCMSDCISGHNSQSTNDNNNNNNNNNNGDDDDDNNNIPEFLFTQSRRTTTTGTAAADNSSMTMTTSQTGKEVILKGFAKSYDEEGMGQQHQHHPRVASGLTMTNNHFVPFSRRHLFATKSAMSDIDCYISSSSGSIEDETTTMSPRTIASKKSDKKKKKKEEKEKEKNQEQQEKVVVPQPSDSELLGDPVGFSPEHFSFNQMEV